MGFLTLKNPIWLRTLASGFFFRNLGVRLGSVGFGWAPPWDSLTTCSFMDYLRALQEEGAGRGGGGVGKGQAGGFRRLPSGWPK